MFVERGIIRLLKKKNFAVSGIKFTAYISQLPFQRKILSNLSYLWGRYAGKFPLYTANVSAIHGKDINASGEFYLNFKEKLTRLELNMTTGMKNPCKLINFRNKK